MSNCSHTETYFHLDIHHGQLHDNPARKRSPRKASLKTNNLFKNFLKKNNNQYDFPVELVFPKKKGKKNNDQESRPFFTIPHHFS
jgi:hypothetical protein